MGTTTTTSCVPTPAGASDIGDTNTARSRTRGAGHRRRDRARVVAMRLGGRYGTAFKPSRTPGTPVRSGRREVPARPEASIAAPRSHRRSRRTHLSEGNGTAFKPWPTTSPAPLAPIRTQRVGRRIRNWGFASCTRRCQRPKHSAYITAPSPPTWNNWECPVERTAAR